jgi:hypothetical protein
LSVFGPSQPRQSVNRLKARQWSDDAARRRKRSRRRLGVYEHCGCECEKSEG